MKITVLGCGTSSGVPVIGCDCAVCRSDDPRNKRRRVSILAETDSTRLLIDTPPDLHGQLVDARVARLDAVLYTHGHADHVHGIDDLRSVNYQMKSALDAYGTESTLAAIRGRFDYAFKAPTDWWTRPSLTPITVTGPFSRGDIAVTPFSQGHGRSTTTGYRLNDVAYSTDVNDLSEEAFAVLEGVRLWVVDCLGYQTHPTHAHLSLTLGWIERVKPVLAVLTHMSHQFDYDTLSAELPEGVVPGQDGLVVDMETL
jgi:phosphoribosyl 1,2-cyclic phosphate phosphodiesterase